MAKRSYTDGQLRDLYVVEGKTIAEISAETGTTVDRLKKLCSGSKWVKQRAQFGTKADERTDAKTIEKISDDRSEVNRVHYEMWGSVIAKLQDALKAALELDEIETITKALDRAQKGQRLAKDMVTDKTSQEVTGSMSVNNISGDQVKRMAREVLEDGD